MKKEYIKPVALSSAMLGAVTSQTVVSGEMMDQGVSNGHSTT